uniref:Electron transfer flavoprotein regulatory factor 1 n=1 Tax=Suricata suricatta TaxID=37032 RepID=A0A673V0N4_SURSU
LGRQAPPTCALGQERKSSRRGLRNRTGVLPGGSPPPSLTGCPQHALLAVDRAWSRSGRGLLRLWNAGKCLLYLGRDYPKGADYFKRRLKNVFLKNKDVKDPEKIKELIERGEFVMKELEALYFLRKYRAMKQRYYTDNNKSN